MSELLSFAKRELALLRDPSGEPDEMQDAMDAHILKMVEVFAAEGHSGYSASYSLSILSNLLSFKPLTPLRGTDEEWTVLDYDLNMAAQNKRCSHVFKRADGTAYDSNAIVFEEPDGSRYSGAGSVRDITFPYVPSQTVVLRPAS